MLRTLQLVVLTFCSLAVMATATGAAEFRVEIAEGMPEGIDKSIVDSLDSKHLKLRMDDDSDLCEIWTTKTWTTGEGPAEEVAAASDEVDLDKPKPEAAEPTAPICYPLRPGSLVGVIRLDCPCFDLRQQEIPAGTYTLRYAVQPAYEAHRDTHESRDFLLLVSPEIDKSTKPIGNPDQLIGKSAEAVQAPHPAFLPLLKAVNTEREDVLRPDDRDPDGAILLLKGKDEAGKEIPLELIVPKSVDSF